MHRTITQNLTILLLFILIPFLHAQEKRALTLEDVMKFKQIKEFKISEKGKYISFAAKPDRGNWDLIVKSAEDGKEQIIPNGSRYSTAGNRRVYH